MVVPPLYFQQHAHGKMSAKSAQNDGEWIDSSEVGECSVFLYTYNYGRRFRVGKIGDVHNIIIYIIYLLSQAN